jgi:hypothetical protein
MQSQKDFAMIVDREHEGREEAIVVYFTVFFQTESLETLSSVEFPPVIFILRAS